ncbi:helix-turn-helix transcriptional regulator [Cohnella algarum]|uniref:helix-turn-helix transcriptional regulator n=1 Tax=Cohnella algarum TaxID=2044859 RepID=UPI001966DFDF|nr:helix-turn-helix transcriptional regulator [Cohnella algarum]MBN2979993.1 AraC family transcriptional regulator [Cohnella algarum]
MSLLEFTVPPLLHYIACGHTIFVPGDRHMSRRNIRVFDLLFVRKGCLFMGEEDRHYEVGPGCALILRPDCFHYGQEGCRERTEYYWLHFQTTGAWAVADGPAERSGESNDSVAGDENFAVRTFSIRMPQFIRLAKPGKAEELFEHLSRLHPNAHLSAARFKQQLLFQELAQLLAASPESRRASPGKECAERAAAFLRSRYREEITVKELGESLNFHPVYIARCMQREYGCTPMEYLLRFRIEQSKLLLMQTDWTVARIAEEVGFNQAPYFSSCFSRLEGMSPRQYRQLFH